jgi:hypothetical protein
MKLTARAAHWVDSIRSRIVNRIVFTPSPSSESIVDCLPPEIRRFSLPTSDRETIEAFHLSVPGATQLVIYFHGSSGNIARRLPELKRIAALGVEVFGVSYRGFGASSGRPSERGICLDGQTALAYAVDELGFSPDRIFLFGRSIGSAVALQIAAGQALAGIILVTPISSGRDYMAQRGWGVLSKLAGPSYDNLSRCDRIIAPVLFVHGSRDEITPLEMARRLRRRLRTRTQLVVVNQAGHADLEIMAPDLYWSSIQRFILRQREYAAL